MWDIRTAAHVIFTLFIRFSNIIGIRRQMEEEYFATEKYCLA